MTTKICNVCEVEKPYSEFYKDPRIKSGIRSMCKVCASQACKRYRNRNGKVLKEKAARYRKANKDKIKKVAKNYRSSEEYRDKMKKYRKEYHIKNGKKVREKVRIYRKSPALYETYGSQLTVEESPRPDKNGYLLVKCAYCGRYYQPTAGQVQNRIVGLNQCGCGELRLYCSSGCKKACPIFNKIFYPAGFKEITSREVQAELRQMVLYRDNYECQRCGVGIKDVELHAHHITGIVKNPIESADIDNCITLCKSCHKIVHMQKGCRYFELKCRKAA